MRTKHIIGRGLRNNSQRSTLEHIGESISPSLFSVIRWLAVIRWSHIFHIKTRFSAYAATVGHDRIQDQEELRRPDCWENTLDTRRARGETSIVVDEQKKVRRPWLARLASIMKLDEGGGQPHLVHTHARTITSNRLKITRHMKTSMNIPSSSCLLVLHPACQRSAPSSLGLREPENSCRKHAPPCWSSAAHSPCCWKLSRWCSV